MFNNPYDPYLFPNNSIYNPNLSAMQRMQQLERQYQMPQQSQQQRQGAIIMPVSNQEEANAYIVSPEGTPTFFYNAGKKEIYLKQTNKDTGSADFFVFKAVKAPTKEEKEEKQEKEEKEKPVTYEKDFKALNDKIDGLYSILSKPETVEEEIPEKPIKGAKNAK